MLAVTRDVTQSQLRQQVRDVLRIRRRGHYETIAFHLLRTTTKRTSAEVAELDLITQRKETYLRRAINWTVEQFYITRTKIAMVC